MEICRRRGLLQKAFKSMHGAAGKQPWRWKPKMRLACEHVLNHAHNHEAQNHVLSFMGVPSAGLLDDGASTKCSEMPS